MGNENEVLLQKLEGKSKDLKAETEEKNRLDTLHKELTVENLSSQSRLAAYEQLICANEDMNSKIDTLEKTVGVLTREKKKLEKELETTGTQMEAIENKCNAMEQKLIQTIKQKDSEISALVSTVKELKMRMRVYVPYKVLLSIAIN